MLSNFLQQPYPIERSRKTILINALITGAFISTFLLIFRPFGIADLIAYAQPIAGYLTVIGYGVITALVMITQDMILRYYHTKWEPWLVWKEILSIISLLILIATGNFLYTVTFGYTDFTLSSLLAGIFYTVSIGVFPTISFMTLNYIKLLHRHQRTANSIQINGDFGDDLSTSITLRGENKEEIITSDLNSLLCLQAADNYVMIYQNSQTPLLIRSSIQRLQDQINHPWLIRCHRSYIVNLSQVQKVTGNAAGYKLTMLHSDITVPVSRSYIATIQNALENLPR